MTCLSPSIIVGGVVIPTSEFENAQELVSTVSDDQGDPTFDEYTENVANGNNTGGVYGVQVPSGPVVTSTQTTLPTPIPFPADESNTSAPPGSNGAPVSCIIWDGVDYDVQLSTHFTLRNFTIGSPSTNPVTWPHPLGNASVAGFSMQTRFCNLQALAINIAEPMYAKFGKFRVNSGIRNISTTPTGISQHVKGEAIDIQFDGWSYARYWDNAAWIKDNIPYDQFIFEHSSTSGLAWYHLSFNQSGNRVATSSTKVMTMYRNHFDSGLKRYG